MSGINTTSEQKKTVVTLLAGAVLVVLTQTALSPALPSIMSMLDVDATTVQWLTSAYALTEAVVIPLAAWFMGRFSTRTLFALSMGMFGIGGLVGAFAPVFAVVLFGRILQAAAAGVMMVMVMALILLAFPKEHRGKAMGVVSLVIGFAPAIGPSLGGLVVDFAGWRALFLMVAVLAVAIIALSLRCLKNERPFPRTRFDVFSAALSTFGLVCLLYGLSSFTSTDNTGLCAGLLVVGLAFVALFARRQFSVEKPLLRLDALKSRRYRVAILCVVFLQAILIGLVVLMPIYIQNILGYSATVSGLVILPGAFLGALAGLMAGRFFDRYGIRLLAIGGGLLLLVSGVGMFCYGMDSPIWFVMLANMLNGISIQLLVTPLITWGINSLSDELVQHATAVTNTMNQIGGAFGTAVIMSFSEIGRTMSSSPSELGSLFDGYHLSYGVVLVFSAIVLVLVVSSVRSKRSEAVPVDGSSPSTASMGRRLVKDVMSESVLTAPCNMAVSEMTACLADADASGAVLTGNGGEIEGFVSNSDILRFFGEESSVVVGGSGFTALAMLDNDGIKERIGRMSKTGVMEIATRKVEWISPNSSFEEACRVIAEKRLKELPVVEDGRLVGVVRRRDLMKFIARAMTEGAEGRFADSVRTEEANR